MAGRLAALWASFLFLACPSLPVRQAGGGPAGNTPAPRPGARQAAPPRESAAQAPARQNAPVPDSSTPPATPSSANPVPGQAGQNQGASKIGAQSAGQPAAAPAATGPVAIPLGLRVHPVRVSRGIAFPYDASALGANVADRLGALFKTYHRTARFDVESDSPPKLKPGSAPENSAAPSREAPATEDRPAYILDLEITGWNAAKFPPEITVRDELAEASSGKKLFAEDDAVLDDGSGNFPDVIAKVLAGRIYSRFAALAHDPRPAPEACLTEGCAALTRAYKIGGIAAWAVLAGAGAAASGGGGRSSRRRWIPARPTSSARVRAGAARSAHSRRPPSLLPYGPRDFDRDADEYGYVPTKYQHRFIEHTLGYAGCYDPKQKPTPGQMKLLDDVTLRLKGGYYKVPNFYWTVLYMEPRPGCLNSSSIPQLRMVFVYTSLMAALHWNRDEIAAVIGHEAGHLQDRYCGRIGAAEVSLTALQSLEQVCEKHADNIGIQYLLGAGFDPTRFAYTFATLENTAPQGQGIRARLFSSHPVARGRITNVTHALEALCGKGMVRACQFLPLRPEPAVNTGGP